MKLRVPIRPVVVHKFRHITSPRACAPSPSLQMPSDPSKPSQLSCTSCRHRKVKCDKAKPCSACRRSNVECIFPNRPFKPRGRQGGSKARNAEIAQRLQRLEGLVGKLGGENAAGALLHSGSIIPSIESTSSRRESLKERQGSSSQSPRSQDIEPISQADGSRYLGNDFWSSLSGEVRHPLHTSFQGDHIE